MRDLLQFWFIPHLSSGTPIQYSQPAQLQKTFKTENYSANLDVLNSNHDLIIISAIYIKYTFKYILASKNFIYIYGLHIKKSCYSHEYYQLQYFLWDFYIWIVILNSCKLCSISIKKTMYMYIIQFLLVKTSYHNRLATWTGDSTGKFMFIFLPTVIKMLKASAFTSISNDPLVTSSSNDRVLRKGQCIWRAWVCADLALKFELTSNHQNMSSLAYVFFYQIP